MSNNARSARHAVVLLFTVAALQPTHGSREAPVAAKERLLSASLRIQAYDFPVTENLDVAIRTIGARTLEPGATFSLNATLGRRTLARGYRRARGYSGTGAEVSEIGGGLCMLSTALYLAFARAGLEIVERHPHLRPVAYAEPGLDATVNFPYKDLKVRNHSDRPVRLRVFRSGRLLAAEVRVVLEPNVELRLDRVVSRAEIPGQVTNGFRVKTTRTFLKDGLPLRSELLSEDVFAAVDMELEGTP